MARSRSREARTGFPAGLYGNILPKGNLVRNEAGAGHSKSQQKGYEKRGLVGYLQERKKKPKVAFETALAGPSAETEAH